MKIIFFDTVDVGCRSTEPLLSAKQALRTVKKWMRANMNALTVFHALSQCGRALGPNRNLNGGHILRCGDCDFDRGAKTSTGQLE